MSTRFATSAAILMARVSVLGLLATADLAQAAEPGKVTIVSIDRATEVTTAPIAGESPVSEALWVPVDELPKLIGAELKPEGLCVGEICMPLEAAARQTLVQDHAGRSYVDLLGLAARLKQPVAAEPAEGVWSFGEIPAVREATWTNAEAPDFSLPNREGKEVKLSDFRGKKVLLLTWASW